MKLLGKTLALLLAAVIVLFVFTSCGSDLKVDKTFIDDANHIIVLFSDGKTADLGEAPKIEVPGPGGDGVTLSNVTVDGNGKVIAEFSDGSTKEFGKVNIDPGQTGEPLSVKEITVNGELHAIAEMSDGSKVDLGYVGVEVVPPLYLVKFVDVNGKLLSEQKVYKGQSAEAPEAPKVEDATFDKWDADYTNIQSDITIRPVYIGAETYTVTFLDDKGNVLSTQSVISGHAASAPNTPSYEDKIFDTWDKAFSKITSDLTVNAIYRDRKTLTVTFKDYSGVTLGTATVKEGGTVTAPVKPTREGYKFTGWSSSLSDIYENKTVTAKYSLNSGSNIFDISYEVKNDVVTVTFKVNGNVKFCGMEGSVKVPSELSYQSLSEGDGATANYKDGTVFFMFASNNGKNITSATTVMTVKFKLASGIKSAKFDVNISDMYDQDYNNVAHSVIGSTLVFN